MVASLFRCTRGRRRSSSIPSWGACANHRPGSHERSLPGRRHHVECVATAASRRGGSVSSRWRRKHCGPDREEQRTSTIDTVTLLTAVVELREALGDVPLSVELPGAGEARAQAGSAVRQLDDYVLPRLRDVDAPVLAVVGGSTGSGKSTLVNSLVGADVSRSGVLRPTTRSPVLVHHPDAGRWFADDRILPGLARVRGGSSEDSGHIELVARDTVPETVALLDAPDIDSVVDANRAMAAQLLDAADLWLFVTTAARYADAVPWEFLRRAVARGVGIGLVLNRVPPGAVAEIGPHLAEMLRTEGLGMAVTFTIEEQPLVDGRLPAGAVQPLKAWIGALAADEHARDELVRRSLVGTIGELAVRSERVAVAAEYQDEMLGWLGDRARDAFDRAVWNVAVDVRDGTVMRGEVLARWQDVVGTGELLRSLQSSIGRFRDRVTSAVTGRPRNSERFQGAVTSGVETVVLERVAAGDRRGRRSMALAAVRRGPHRRAGPGRGRSHAAVARAADGDRSHGARLAGRVDGSAAP